MDIKSLKLFLHLAESCHFSRTAKAMYISPSALSRQIQRLEEQLGCTLLWRDNRTVRLTEAGRELQRFAKQTLAQFATLQNTLQQHEQALYGELHLFCSVTAAYSHLPPILDNYRANYPFVEIKLTTGDAADAIERLQKNHTDLAITGLAEQLPTNLLFTPIDTIPFVLIYPVLSCQVSWLVTQHHLDWEHIPFILPEHGPTRRCIDHWFKQQKISHPLIYATVAGHEAILPMVALGCGVALIPAVVLHHCPEVIRHRIEVLEQITMRSSLQLGICTLKKRLVEPLINAFWQSAKHYYLDKLG